MKRGVGSLSILFLVIIMFSLNIIFLGWSNDIISKITGKNVGDIDSSTKLLMHMDDAGLTDATGKSVILNGGVARSSAQSKFGGYSAYFDGTDDYLKITSSSDFAISSSDEFTVDFWYKHVGNPYPASVFFCQDSVQKFQFWTTTSNPLRFFIDNAVIDNNNAGAVRDGNWHHVAIVRKNDGGTLKIGISLDGSFNGWTANSENVAADALVIGTWTGKNQDWLNGYIDELRISKGVARWTSNFVPPTSAYSSISSSSTSPTSTTTSTQNTTTSNATASQNASSTSQTSTVTSTNATTSTTASQTATSSGSSSQTGIITQEGICQGCEYEDKCLPIGTRLSINSSDSFCSIEQKFEIQKDDDSDCFNNYECSTNQCSSQKCVNVTEELNTLNNIMNDIWNFLKGVFGGGE